MKNKNIPFICLITVINEVCGSDTKTVKNTGGRKQCLEGAVRVYALAKDTFSFTTLAEAKTKTAWDTAKEAKDVVIFYDVEELEPSNTEAVIKNGRFRDFDIKDAIKGVNYTHYLSTCSHEALKSYQNSEYTRIFRITEKNEVLCEVQDDGSIKGEPLTSFIVGIRDDAPADGTPSTKVNLKFDAYALSIFEPSFDIATDYEGIYNVVMTQVSASSTVIKLTAATECSGTKITTFADGDFQVLDASGDPVASTFSGPDASGVYTLTGTGFATGYTVEIVDVVVETDVMYEGAEALDITVS